MATTLTARNYQQNERAAITLKNGNRVALRITSWTTSHIIGNPVDGGATRRIFKGDVVSVISFDR